MKNEFDLIAVYYSKTSDFKLAHAIAKKTQLPLINEQNQNYKYFLVVVDNNVYIKDNINKQHNIFSINFNCPKLQYRVNKGGNFNQDILKAVNIKPNNCKTIFDATAGLGLDSFLFASFGANVVMCERSIILYILLKLALKKGAKQQNLAPTCKKITLINANSIDYLKNVKLKPDIVYIDPMFPVKKKTALPKKEMLILRDLVGNDIDAKELCTIAVKTAKHRVVIKRPNKSEYILDYKPQICYQGKANRFDVYLTN